MKICVPIQERTQKKVIQKLQFLKGKVELAEIWLDHIEDLDISSLLKNKPLPVLCVCKKADDKGRFKGSYPEMIKILKESSESGADYIDIPHSALKHLKKSEFRDLAYLQAGLSSEIIISYHNFKKTPSHQMLLKKAKEMRKAGADIVKIATMANSLEDAFTIISLAQLLQEEKIPNILIAMGQKGILSRVLTPFLGGTIMFAPLTKKGVTASGQLTVGELKKAWSLIEK
ncbi:type I 3-dehydroquinate dehydratase [Candidatus Pacearchaeota archaeon]|nr:type I 3-dehydroquinate dehydratase [Candidatus Pacearchaeota archaeon]